ncbi:MAG: hypothetical protein ACR2O2_04155 [Ruegeria sp.]
MNLNVNSNTPVHTIPTDVETLYCKRKKLRKRLAVVPLSQSDLPRVFEGDIVRLKTDLADEIVNALTYWQIAMIEDRNGAPYAYCVPEAALNCRSMLLV